MNPNNARESIGDLVIATDQFWGRYIGELVDVYCQPLWRAKVRVLACVTYPSQSAIMGPAPFQRHPYKYVEIENFDLGGLEPFNGDTIPDYDTSVNTALDKAIGKSVGEYKRILLRHKSGQALKV